MTDTSTLPRSVAEQALDALKIGHESAHDCAETFHIEMAGYKQQRHEALDAEVKQISDAIGVLRAALDQPQDRPEQRLDMVPAGWKLVPVEPTDEMVEAGDHEIEKWGVDASSSGAFRAMLAAAPQPPVVEQPQPLTIEQIARIDSATEWPEGSLRNIGPRDWRRLLVTATRAIERAHGIGGEE